MFLLKLAISGFLARRARVALTCSAIALSVSLVVAVTSGYSSVLVAAERFVGHYLGNADVLISRRNNPRGGVPEKLVAEISADARVKNVIGRLELRTQMINESGDDPEPWRTESLTGIRRPQDTLVDNMRIESGAWFTGDAGDVAVIDQTTASSLHLQVGSSMPIPGLGKPHRVKIVGIAHKPEILAMSHSSVYVPLKMLQTYAGFPGEVTRIQIQLKPGLDPDAFADDWSKRLAAPQPELRVRSTGQAKHTIDQQLESVHILSYMGGMVSMLAATFIILSALLMGVAERQRVLAMLRAVGALKRQVAGLVLIEGLAFAAVGVLIGVPLGYLWIQILAWEFPKIFIIGVVISWGGVLMGSLGALLSALLASLLPAWSASRVRPLEAMSAQSRPRSSRAPFFFALCGLALVCVDPLLFYGPVPFILEKLGFSDPVATARSFRFVGHFVLGLPCMMVGFFLISPLMVVLFEYLVAPVVAFSLRVRFSMLRQQLSSGVWRAAGTCTALMVGLAALIALQVQGNSALNGWKLPDKFPDIFIATSPIGGVVPEDVPKMEKIKGIKKGEIMPLAMASPGIPSGFLGMMRLMALPDATMFFGIDPDKAFKLMELEFRQGNATDAARMLKLGRHIIITEEFRQLKGLGVGDKLALETLHGPVDYTVAGVIWSPGMDVLVSAYDMGSQMDQRTAASVFGTLEDARRDFGVERYNLFAANLDDAVDKRNVLHQVEYSLKLHGMMAGDVRELKGDIDAAFRRMLLMISTVAFAAMAVASLGVTNTIMASVRSRRWEFGILRSIGVTRGMLLRLVIAEALLLGFIGIGLGLSSGTLMSADARQLSLMVTGYNPPLSIPWGMIGIGVGVVVLISVLASIGPAIAVARAEPLALLQAGRSSS